MKQSTIYLIIFFVFNCCNIWSQQSAFYDAIYIRDNCFDGRYLIKSNNLNTILKKYYKDQINDSILKSNPFFKDYINTFSQQSNTPLTFKDVNLSSFAGINVTTVADALSKFIINRAKEELSIAFFQKFKDEMKDDKYEDLRILFPETYRMLNNIDVEIYQYSGYLNSLREAFQHDLSNAFSNLEDVFNTQKYSKYFDDNKPLKAVIDNSFQIINDLRNNKHPGEIIANYPINKIESFDDQNFVGAFKTIQLISNSLRSKSSDHYWIGADSLELLFKDNDLTAFTIYMGLLYQQAENESITFANGVKLTDKMKILAKESKSLVDSLNKYKTFIENFVYYCQNIDDNINIIRQKNSTEIDYNDYYQFISSAIDLFEMSEQIKDLPYISMTITPKFSEYLFIARRTSDIYLDVNQHHYSAAIVNSIGVLDTVFFNLEKSEKGLPDTSPEKIKLENFKKTLKLILKYGSFMASVAQAKNSDEVEGAIEAIALPAGSYRLKRSSCFAVELNTYLGGTLYQPSGINIVDNSVTKLGLSAPIGMDISFKICNWSISGFIPIIDLGPIVNYRFQTSDSSLPDIKFGDILAPGFFGVVGFPGVPISLGLGGQFSTQLKSIANSSAFKQENQWNWKIFLAVDIPLLRIYTTQ